MIKLESLGFGFHWLKLYLIAVVVLWVMPLSLVYSDCPFFFPKFCRPDVHLETFMLRHLSHERLCQGEDPPMDLSIWIYVSGHNQRGV